MHPLDNLLKIMWLYEFFYRHDLKEINRWWENDGGIKKLFILTFVLSLVIFTFCWLLLSSLFASEMVGEPTLNFLYRIWIAFKRGLVYPLICSMVYALLSISIAFYEKHKRNQQE